MMIRPIMPDFSAFTADGYVGIANCLIILISTALAAYLVSAYAAKRFKGNKQTTALGFIGIAVCFAVLLICFFGCTAVTVRGIIFCIILILSSYSDIRTRECNDWLHVMIVTAAFIGCEFSNLANMFVSAMFTGGIMLLTALITDCKKVGGADIKFAAACSFLLGLEKSIIALIVGMISAVIINLCRGKEKRKSGFPLIPYIAAGYLAAYLI